MTKHVTTIKGLLAAFILTAMQSVSAAVPVIDFEVFESPSWGPGLWTVANGTEDATAAGSPIIDHNFLGQGFVFTPGPDNSSGFNDLHLYNNKTTPTTTTGITVPWNGTTVLASHDDLIMTRQGGGAFNFYGFDYAGFANGAAFEGSITITGHFFGGGTITQTFTPDGFIDNLTPGGDIPDFQRVFLNGDCGECEGGWYNLVQVDFSLNASFATTQDLFAIDNVDVVGVVVPEPGTFLLFGIGLLGLMQLARRNKRA